MKPLTRVAYRRRHPALRASFNGIGGIALNSLGHLIFSDANTHRIAKIESPLPGFTNNEFLIPSENGREIYHFNSAGKHLHTYDSLTGAVLYEFIYDSDGYLAGIKDANNNLTTIVRQGAIPLTIIAPDGQRTELGVDGNVFLNSITNHQAGLAHRHASTTHHQAGLALYIEKDRQEFHGRVVRREWDGPPQPASGRPENGL